MRHYFLNFHLHITNWVDDIWAWRFSVVAIPPICLSRFLRASSITANKSARIDRLDEYRKVSEGLCVAFIRYLTLTYFRSM